jgi:hypothetical protein
LSEKEVTFIKFSPLIDSEPICKLFILLLLQEGPPPGGVIFEGEGGWGIYLNQADSWQIEP